MVTLYLHEAGVTLTPEPPCFAATVQNSLRVIYDEAERYLRANGVADGETHTLAQACFADWDAYQWIGGSMDGRVRGNAGADDLRRKFTLLAAAVAAHCSGLAITLLSQQSAIDDPKKFCDHLIGMNPGDRHLPYGLNATSGLAHVARLAQLAERAIRDLRLALMLGPSTDLQSSTEMARRGASLLASSSLRQAIIASNPRTVDHARVTSAYDRLQDTLDTRYLAAPIAREAGCTEITVRRILDEDRPNWRPKNTTKNK